MMSDVVITVELDTEVYTELLKAANEAGLPVAEFAAGVVGNYLEENYAQV